LSRPPGVADLNRSAKSMSSNDPKIEAEWLRKLYEEAWKQYCHEDNLGQLRTNFFMGVQAALVAVLTAASKPLYEIGMAEPFGWRMHLGLAFIGIFMSLIGGFCFFVSVRWREVTEAGKQYVLLRWATARAIEQKMPIDVNLGLATIEDRWRHYEGHEPFPLFRDDKTLVHVELAPPEIKGGWLSMLHVIGLWQIACRAIFVSGVLVVLLGVFGFHGSSHQKEPNPGSSASAQPDTGSAKTGLNKPAGK
jgi:hypothetical protein